MCTPQVDQIYSLSQRSATSNSTTDFQVLERCLAELKPDERVLVSSEHMCTIVWGNWKAALHALMQCNL